MYRKTQTGKLPPMRANRVTATAKRFGNALAAIMFYVRNPNEHVFLKPDGTAIIVKECEKKNEYYN